MTESDNKILEEFDKYLAKIKGINPKSRGNYLSWARFLIGKHNLAEISTEEDVTNILNLERFYQTLPERKVYKTKRDFSNFKSTLNRFLPFNQCRICREMAKVKSVSIDDMIDLVGEQCTKDKAQAIYEAIVLIAIDKNIGLSDEQKMRLKANMSKFDCRISVDKFFGPGAHYHVTNA